MPEGGLDGPGRGAFRLLGVVGRVGVRLIFNGRVVFGEEGTSS